MDKSICLLTIVALCLSTIGSVSFITKCKPEDSECIKKSTIAAIPTFAAGLPDYKVAVLDPISFKKIDASSQNLKLVLTDIVVTGIKDCKVKKAERDVAKSKLHFLIECTCKLEGQYEMNGRLLVLPLEGQGPLHVSINKVEITLDIDMGDKTDKNGVEHWNVKKWEYTYELKDKSEVVFENLFNGNEVLAKAAKEVISQSGNDIILEVGPPVMKAIIGKVVNNINSFFHNIPASELSM